ncbi:hypothetical protein EJ110_NYTH38419 [Nymphaea thermarum]|nr:hypothetical protein EJ110_NYTH38419 [Nymphaea thermarum]
MVVKMMKWRPWPPLITKKYQVKLVLKRIEGVVLEEAPAAEGGEGTRFMVEIKWKGQKPAFTSLRRKVVRNFTAERTVSKKKDGEEEGDGGVVVEWEEEFSNVCSLSAYKENCFHPWEISFTLLNVSSQGPKNKMTVTGTATVNLADFVAAMEEKEVESNVLVALPGGSAQPQPTLTFSFSLLELRNAQEPSESVPRLPAALSPLSEEASLGEKEELSALKASLRKVKILTSYVSTRRTKKAFREDESSDGRYSGPSDDAEYAYPFDTDSIEDAGQGVDDDKESSSFRKSFSYGTLASANYVGGSYYPGIGIDEGNEGWVYYSNHRSEAGGSLAEESSSGYVEPSSIQSSKRSILPWRKRKLSFRSPKSKGEPLLKKQYAEEGGDDIDFDRRQLSSSDESFALGWTKGEEDAAANRSSVSDFGDDSFAVGHWESKEVISRDGHMKLCTEVFFASIDQRSERAAGESACTALVAVIADWLQCNRDIMPNKSQFDSLIREGSLEWRNLCENEAYMQRFPDKHFDLETVLEAKVRPLSVKHEKSFVGFFHPDGMDDGLEFLQGAMSFDSIWEEISNAMLNCSDCEPHVYIVSWNDHFFILKVEADAYYIVDTLGERLFEGCSEAYILKFNKDTSIFKLPEEPEGKQDKSPNDSQTSVVESKSHQQPEVGTSGSSEKEATDNTTTQDELICSGKESCKEYIKNFLAAIPLRELQVDIKKGLMTTPLHHRLQIEFHYTAYFTPPSTEVAVVQVPTEPSLT